MLLRTSLRSFFAHKDRMALSLIAVVLSVAFVSGTLVFSNTATSTFSKLFAATASDISVQPPKPADDEEPQAGDKPATVPAPLAQQVASVPGVKTAIGQVMVGNAILVNPATNKLVGPTSGAPTLVGNWTDTPRNPVKITSGHVPQNSGELVLDADTAKKAGLGIGDKVKRRIAAPARKAGLISGEDAVKSLLSGNWLYTPSLLYRQSALSKIPYRPDIDAVHDLAFMVDMLMEGGNLLVDEREVFRYRRHQASDSSTRVKDGKRFDEELRYYGLIAKELRAKGWNAAARSADLHLSSRLHALMVAAGRLGAGDFAHAGAMVGRAVRSS